MNLWTEINLRDDRDYLDYRVKEPFPCSPALTNGWGCMSRIFIKLHPCSVGKKAMINDGCLSQQLKWRVVAHVSIICALVSNSFISLGKSRSPEMGGATLQLVSQRCSFSQINASVPQWFFTERDFQFPVYTFLCVRSSLLCEDNMEA